MRRIVHRYYVSYQILSRLEKYVVDNPDVSIDDVLKLFRRLKLFYRCGLSKLDS